MRRFPDALERLLGPRRRQIPLVLIKKKVSVLLEPKLKETRFNVLNSGRRIDFASNGQQGKFHEQFPDAAPQDLRGLTPA